MNPMIKNLMIAAGIAPLLAARVSLAQVDVAPPPSSEPANAAPPPVIEAPPGGGNMDISPPSAPVAESATKPAATAPAPTASAVLENLLEQRGGNPESATSTATQPQTQPGERTLEHTTDGLIREGQLIQARSGKLKKDDATGATLFVFDDKGIDYPPMAAVPSRRLMLMEDAAGFGEAKAVMDMVFPIDAEITQYRGKNYLYIRPSADPIPRPSTAPATAPATMPTVAGVLPAPQINSVAPDAPPLARIAEGKLIEQVVGRLVKDARTGAEIISFDSDGKKMVEQPMGLIPCRFLAVMEDVSENGSKPVKFRVSGEVTQYRGKNYLYLRAVTIVKDVHGGLGG